MSRESRKNINSVLHDIKHPKKGPRARQTQGTETKFAKPNKWAVRSRAVIIGFIVAVIVTSSGYFANSSGVFGKIKGSFNEWASGRHEGVAGDPVLSSDVLVELPGFIGKIGDIISALRGISVGVNDLNNRGLALIFSGTGGDEFLQILKRIHTNLGVLNRIGFGVGDKIPSLSLGEGVGTGGSIGDTKNLEKGLGAIINFLDVEENRRIVLLFQNHSEIRPTGGFIGSYGDVVLDKGSVKSIEVDDIYTPDRNVKYKIVPPAQLQSITMGWGARDANWFFDFPVSAEKTLELLEASEMYVNDGVRFDGAVAINANVVSDVLKIVGPIYVPEYDVTLTSENFLLEVREEVEEARQGEFAENPKQILALIAPTLIERVETLDEDAKAELVLALLSRALNKDIQLYFRDAELQEFIAGTPFSGVVYELGDTFNGDYLAVVNANVAGGKSDLFVSQSIMLNSQVSLSGEVRNNLSVERRHFGENEEQALYRKNNQNFIKIFTARETALAGVTGITPKTIIPRISYANSGYSIDPILSAVESTVSKLSGTDMESYLESGKKVYAGWFSTPAGETRTLTLDYSREELFIGDGAQYKFVFDKQSGVESLFRYNLTAPPGYVWRESGNSVYSYTEDSIPGRLVLNLTLVKEDD